MADWDLQAVVRGCCNSSTTTTSVPGFDSPISLLLPPQDDSFLTSPDLFQPRTTDGFEDLFDLFNPVPTKSPLLSSQNRPTSPLSVLGGLQEQSSSVVVPRAIGTVNTHNPTPTKSKRRKNQMKRVCQLPAEGLASDVWSWRKYGQKPIKGSPYPRGYYKCSTSKGCMARKQVERNRSDPGMFIVTYTGEHSHPIPTHRNSLAGSTRHKSVTSPPAADGENKQTACSSPISSDTDNKLDGREGLEDLMEEEEDEFSVPLLDMGVGDDFFEGLEELAGMPSGKPTASGSPATWLARNVTTTAAGGR